MTTITTEDIRGIVRQENRHIEQSMAGMADSIKEVTNAIKELTTLCSVYEERSANTSTRIDEANKLANQANQSVIALYKEELPRIAVNSFSSKQLWGVTFLFGAFMIGLVRWFSAMQTGQIKVLADAIAGAAKGVGG